MGLDMYLMGDKFRTSGFFNKETQQYEPVEPTYVDGFKLSSERLQLGYWRKHAPLHQLIVHNFADGVDDCQPIDLDVAQLRTIAGWLRSDQMPDDGDCNGFFFGNDGEDSFSYWWAECRQNADEDAKVFEAAAAWIESMEVTNEPKFWNSVEYRASW